MKKFLIMLGFVFIGVSTVYATSWQKISDKIYLDKSGITKSSGTEEVYSFWTKELNDGGNDFKLAETKYNQKIWYDLVRYSVDCNLHKFKIEEVLIYGLNNNMIAVDKGFLNGWNSIPPQSIADEYLSIVCKPENRNSENEHKKIEVPKSSLEFTLVNPEKQNTQTKSSEIKNTDIHSPEMSKYIKDLQEKIKTNWEPIKSEKPLKVTLIFSISKEGTLVTLTEFRTSGDKDFDNAATEAVKKSVPFKALPYGNGLDIQLTFDKTIHGFILNGK